jgi:two-component system response regulator YesN
MVNVLVVDDERLIVDGLYELLLQVREQELDVSKAYSAVQAVQMAGRQRVDVCISDIRMPQMDGLALQQELTLMWPRCRMIFLTGYDDFHYAQTAMRQGGFDYILKTDGDEPLLMALQKAIHSLQQEMANERLLSEARQRAQGTAPLLLRELLAGVLQGEIDARTLASSRFADLASPLSLQEQVLLLLARVDDFRETPRPAELSFQLHDLQQLFCQHLPMAATLPVSLGGACFTLLVQPKPPGRSAAAIWDWQRLIRYLLGTLDQLQHSCRDLLSLTVSVVASTSPAAWEQLPNTLKALQRALRYRLGRGRGMLLTDRFAQTQERGPGSGSCTAVIEELKRQLQSQLECGEQGGFLERLGQLFEALAPLSDPVKVEACCFLASTYLSHLNRHGADPRLAMHRDLRRLASFDPRRPWGETRELFGDWAKRLFALLGRTERTRTGLLVSSINRFVEEHLGEELSLTRLSTEFHLNASYLSRLYKQTAGVGLVEHVSSVRLGRAAQLLRSSPFKAQEIAHRVGFDSPAYFGRCFKERFLVTPQQYRERAGTEISL